MPHDVGDAPDQAEGQADEQAGKQELGLVHYFTFAIFRLLLPKSPLPR